jgi:GntR family transcriptional regulator of arabinose operon
MPVTPTKLKYVHLADQIRERIHSGELKVGDRLPSYAEMYRDYGATTATMQRVCDLLENENLIERRNSSGVYVADPTSNLTGNIGFIGSSGYNTLRSPAQVHLMEGVHRALELEQQHLLYLGGVDSWDVEACKKVDGVLIFNSEETPEILRKLPPHLPRVSVLTVVEGVTCVGVDDFGGAQMAVRHLFDLGHRRIACLMEKIPSEARRRYAGFCDAFQEAGIEVDPTWVRLTENVHHLGQQWTTEQPYREWARRQMSAWLKEGWRETGCTAILAQNDVAALGVIQVLQKEGIKVPEQVSVMGFDGTEICDLVTPHICAVALPFEQIGIKSMELLNQQIFGDKSAEQVIMLPLTLRPGESITAVAEIS